MPAHPSTPLPPHLDTDTPATDELDRLALIARDPGHPHGPSKCCRSAEVERRLTRMGDPASHAGDDAPAVLRVSLDAGARMPTRATAGSVGLDLFPLEGAVPRLMPHETRVFDTGVRLEVPTGYVGKVEGRSGMSKRGVAVSGGILDPDYRGSVGIILTNHGLAPWMAEPGKAIAQLVLYPVACPAVMVVGGLGETERGEKGFGSSDVK